MAISIVRSKSVVAAAVLTAIAATCGQSVALTGNDWNGTNGDYNTAGNWSQSHVPNNSEQAVMFNGNITLSANSPSAGGILVSRFLNPTAAQLSTNGHKLTSSGTTAIDEGGQLHLSAPSGSQALETTNLTLTNSSTVDMTGTALAVVHADLSIDATSSFSVGGTLDVADTLPNNGALQAIYNANITVSNFTMTGTSSNIAYIDANGLSLTINALSAFNLHNSNTQIDAFGINSNLTLNGQPDLTPGNVGATSTSASTRSSTFPAAMSGSSATIRKTAPISRRTALSPSRAEPLSPLPPASTSTPPTTPPSTSPAMPTCPAAANSTAALPPPSPETPSSTSTVPISAASPSTTTFPSAAPAP